MRTWTLALPLLLSGCAASIADPAGPQEFAGLYAAGFEVESFQPCGSGESWWVTDGEELRTRYRALAGSSYEPVYVVVRGTAGPRGRYGHLAAYERELAVAEVLEIRRGACPGQSS
jgi:hypothetical protein